MTTIHDLAKLMLSLPNATLNSDGQTERGTPKFVAVLPSKTGWQLHISGDRVSFYGQTPDAPKAAPAPVAPKAPVVRTKRAKAAPVVEAPPATPTPAPASPYVTRDELKAVLSELLAKR